MPYHKRRPRQSRRPRRAYKPTIRRFRPNAPKVLSISRWDHGETDRFSIYSPGPPVLQWAVNANGDYVCRFFHKIFSIADLPALIEFRDLFNWYKINKATVNVNFTWSNVDMGVVMTAPPQLAQNYRPATDFKVVSFLDYTNRTIWDSEDPQYGFNTLDRAKQYQSFRIHTKGYSKNFTRTVYPKVLRIMQMNEIPPGPNQQVLVGAGGQGHMPWMSTSTVNIPAYGMVFGVQPVFRPNNTLGRKWNVAFCVETKYYLSFKGIR